MSILPQINEAVNFPSLSRWAESPMPPSEAPCALPSAAPCVTAPGRSWTSLTAAVSSPINKTYFSLAWLSDGTLLLLPLAYMLAESSDCHAPVNPSQPPWAQPRHHGDTSSVVSHWMPRCSGPPAHHGNRQWLTADFPRPCIASPTPLPLYLSSSLSFFLLSLSVCLLVCHCHWLFHP